MEMHESKFTFRRADDYWFNMAFPTLMVLVETEEDAQKLHGSEQWPLLILEYKFYALLYGDSLRGIRKYLANPDHMQIADAKMVQASYPWKEVQIDL